MQISKKTPQQQNTNPKEIAGQDTKFSVHVAPYNGRTEAHCNGLTLSNADMVNSSATAKHAQCTIGNIAIANHRTI